MNFPFIFLVSQISKLCVKIENFVALKMLSGEVYIEKNLIRLLRSLSYSLWHIELEPSNPNTQLLLGLVWEWEAAKQPFTNYPGRDDQQGEANSLNVILTFQFCRRGQFLLTATWPSADEFHNKGSIIESEVTNWQL